MYRSVPRGHSHTIVPSTHDGPKKRAFPHVYIACFIAISVLPRNSDRTRTRTTTKRSSGNCRRRCTVVVVMVLGGGAIGVEVGASVVGLEVVVVVVIL